MKILIAELMWQVGIDKLQENSQVEYDPDLWKDRNLLLQKVQDVDALIVRNQTQVDEELLRAGKDLKVIGRLGVGLDNINLAAAKKSKIDIIYARNANAISVAEYVMAAILESHRPLFAAHQDIKQGNWNRVKFTGRELYKKTLGLIGMGEIAHRTAKRAQAFSMNIIGYDPFVTPYDYPAAETGILTVTFDQLLQQSDFISIHVPLTPQTRSMFSTSQFTKMKSSAYIINTARGGIIDEGALFDALTAGEIAGAYLDVLEKEPIDPENLLLHCPNAIITPHIAGLTEESQVRTSLLVAEEVNKVLRGEVSLCSLR